MFNQTLSNRMVIFNLYNEAKSCIMNTFTKHLSPFFPCNIGVRQGKNLSPLMFALFLNDLETHLSNAYGGLTYISSLTENCFEKEDIVVYRKLYVLLYADDTIVLAESPTQLQSALDALFNYCETWKMYVNTAKTKVLVFSRGKIRKLPEFKFGPNKFAIVDKYNYLGINFNYNGRFSKAIRHSYEQANRAVLCSKARKLKLPIDIQLELFDSLTCPILLYGCEVWRCENIILIEKLHGKFCKILLGINNRTHTSMVYGELGQFSLNIKITSRLLNFWGKLLTGKESKLSCIMYKLLYQLYVKNIFESPWITHVKYIINSIGLSNVWLHHEIVNLKWFKAVV